MDADCGFYAQVLDTIDSRDGWNFLKAPDYCIRKRRSFLAECDKRVPTLALDGVAPQFNIAKHECIEGAQYVGFHRATVTVLLRLLPQ